MFNNYVKEDQKLPLFGVGPAMIFAMALLTVLAIILFDYVLKIGIVGGVWTITFRIFGILFTIAGIIVWFVGAVRSDMDNSIANNKLKTDGIYSLVRNPMYSGWWMLIFGISLMWHNAWLLFIPFINWLIMTLTLINTEEKWLLETYGEQYAEYKKHVNRCIPWSRE